MNKNASSHSCFISPEGLSRFLELSVDMFVVLNKDGFFQTVSPSWEKALGLTLDELCSRPFIDFVHPADQQRTLNAIDKIFEEGEIYHFENRYCCKDGSYKWLKWNALLLVEQNLIYAIAYDVTRRKQFEKRLKKKQQLLKVANERMGNILESISDGFFVLDGDWNFVYVNKLFESMCNRRREDLIGKNIWEEFPEIKGNLYEEQYRAAMNNKQLTRFQIFSELLEMHFEICVNPSPCGLSVHIRDITEYQHTVRKLKESEAFTHQVAENIKEVFFIYSSDSKSFDYISPAYEEVWGRPIQEIYENPDKFFITIHAEDREKVAAYCKNKWNEPSSEIEYRIIRGNDAVRWIRTRAFLIQNDSDIVQRLASVSEDITEIKEKDTLVRKSDKLMAVGELAAGIAHEIRNPLTAIKGFIQLLYQDNQIKYGGIILEELKRIELILNEFLILAKPHHEIEFEDNKEVGALLKNVLVLLSAEAALRNINFISMLDDNLPLIRCEEKQIKQVLINVIKNAMEAMPDGGDIKIKVGREDEKNIYICVTDQGIGIPEDRILRLGEPFYSNKEKGTGLGLMVSFRIIDNHNGKLVITSEEGEGTTVRIILPN